MLIHSIGRNLSAKVRIRLLSHALDVKKLRNVGICAHIDAGKTTTSEQMLYACGAIRNVGRVDSGDTVMDFLPQERERGITISSAATKMKWRDYDICIIDTPGHVDFTIEVERTMRVLDGSILVLDAVSGVQAQTKTVWKQVTKQSIPAIAFINKMDRDGSDFNRSIDSIRTKLGANPIPIQYPLGAEDNFLGFVDLISMRSMMWPSSQLSPRAPNPPVIKNYSESDSDYENVVNARKKMLENIAEVDDQFFEKLMSVDDSKITESEIIDALRRSCLSNTSVPALCGASLKGKGIEPLLNSIITFLPSPSERSSQKAVHLSNHSVVSVLPLSNDLCALAFKVVHDKEKGQLVYVRIFSGTITTKQMLRNSTRGSRERVHQLLEIHADEMTIVDEASGGQVVCLVGLKDTRTGDTLVLEKGPLHSYKLDGLSIPPPVYSLSIEPESSARQKDLDHALTILELEDPSLVIEVNKESGQTILRGIGELHLEIVCDKIRRNFGVEVYTGRSYIGYRESILAISKDEPVTKRMVYDKMIGNKRMFAGIEFQVHSTDPLSKPSHSLAKELKMMITADEINALTEGFENGFIRGPLGYPIIGMHVTVSSIEKTADTTAGSIRACVAQYLDYLLKSEHRDILEPIMSAEIDVPVQFVGEILSDISTKRRGEIVEVVSSGTRNVVMANIPLSTMLGYASTLRSMTHGEGSFSLEYASHQSVDLSYVQQY
jgi:elongation factor G